MIAWTHRELGAAVRDARLQQGWTQAVLANRIGTSRRWVIELEKGKPSADLGLVIKTLDHLGLVLDVRPAPASRGDIDLDQLLDRNIQDQP